MHCLLIGERSTSRAAYLSITKETGDSDERTGPRSVDGATSHPMRSNAVSISFTCTCGKRMKAPDNLAGKKVKCAGCKKITVIPYPSCSLDDARLALLRP